jgi:uncharacterized protein involved in outer membrane biogenesis
MTARWTGRRLAVVGAAVAAAVAIGWLVLTRLDADGYRADLIAQLEAATGREVAIGGDMDLALGLTPRLTVERVRVANPEWAAAQSMLQAERVRVDIAPLPLLWGDLRLHGLTLQSPRLNLERGADGQASWRFARAEPGGRDNVLAGLRRLRVADATVSIWRDGRVERLWLRELEATGADDMRLAVSGLVRLRDVDVSLDGTVGAPALLLEADNHFPLDLAFHALNADLQLSGSIINPAGARRLDLEVDFRSPQPQRLAARLGLSGVPAETLSFGGRLTGSDAHFALRRLSGRFGETTLEGRGTLDLSGARPKVSADLRAPVVDLRPFGRGPAAPVDARMFPETPLPWALIRRVDADLELEVQVLRLARGLVLNALAGTVTVEAGQLDLPDFKGRALEAALEGSFSADAHASPPRVELRLDGEAIPYGAMLRKAGLTDGVEGAGDVSLSLASAGETPRALAAGAQGKVSVQGREGRVANALVQAAGPGLAELLAPWRRTSKDIQLTCAVARFDVAEGRMTTNAALADTRTATIGAEGAIDLGAERYDLRLVPQAKDTRLVRLAAPVRIVGPLAQPRIEPASSETARNGQIAIGNVVNPLVTLGALVVESETGARNPCVAAIEQAKRRPGAASDPAAGRPSSDDEPDGGGGFFERLEQSVDRVLRGSSDDDEDGETLLPGREHERGR